MIGKSLGHYQITEKLGNASVSEVYPTDARHIFSHLAFKLPPHEFSHGSEWLDRSDRRARNLLQTELRRR